MRILPLFMVSVFCILANLVLSSNHAWANSIKHVFVIAMENEDASDIYTANGSTSYITSLIRQYASASRFEDELPKLPSEPHYIWMEAGNNAFADRLFANDADPSSVNSTASIDHLVSQIRRSRNVTWMTYQESLSAASGSCPIHSIGLYAAKHNPFVFFQDVAGNPPSKENAYCAEHSKPYGNLVTDMAANDIANYVFISPNLCNDMHGARACPSRDNVKTGNDWLRSELPGLISWADANSGVILVTWDQGSSQRKFIPFLAIGKYAKAHFVSGVSFNHGSIMKSVEEIFQLPILPTVSSSADLSDLFTSGSFP
jgi:phosphatidylinositol-3-phosphatase